MAPSPPTLLTFAPMIDSELARLVLDHHGVAWQERDHLFGWASLLTLLHGGYGQIPILYGPGVHLTGPRAIAEHYDPAAAPDRRLIPIDGPARASMEKGWSRYNGGMATDTAVVAYHHLLPERNVMIEVFRRFIPPGEARLVPSAYGLLKGLFTLLLRLSATRADAALARIRRQFAETDAILADGRPFLDGDRTTLADLALISAAAPLIMPDHYGPALPGFDVMPPALQDIVASLRPSRTADHVRRFYEGRAEVTR